MYLRLCVSSTLAQGLSAPGCLVRALTSSPLHVAAGEYNLRLGITKELHPDMVSTHQGEACLECSSC